MKNFFHLPDSYSASNDSLVKMILSLRRLRMSSFQHGTIHKIERKDMKIKSFSHIGVLALMAFAMTSCFEDGYDLGNIDTTAKFQTSQLVVPINIDNITLEQVLDIDDDGEIVKVYDQNRKIVYAIKKSGSFSSTDVVVDRFSIPIPEIAPTVFELDLEDLRKIADYVKKEGNPVAFYEITEQNSIDVFFESDDIHFDNSIKQMERLGVTTQFSVKLKVDGLSQEIIRNTKLAGLKIQFPKAMHLTPDRGQYDQATGILDLSGETLQLNNRGELDISFKVDGITYNASNITIDYERHNMSFKGSVRIIAGKIEVYADTNLENSIKLKSEYFLDNIDVHSLEGKVEYALDDLHMDSIQITNLPDLLSKDGTKFGLENPQIYISLSNPLHDYDMLFQTDLQITAWRHETKKTYRPDDGTFRTQSAKAVDNEFLLSPEIPSFYCEGYSNPQHVRFTSLKHALSDFDGIPTTIEFDAIEPLLSSSQTNNFRLGESHGPVTGEYTFFAPLQMSEGSLVMYTDTIDGWNDEDVDAIIIESLSVVFDASTDVPFDTELSILPVDKTGKVISGVECTKASLPAGAKEHHMEVFVTGTITHLDGIEIQARLVNRDKNSMLTPDMNLSVKNCKVTVTGSYMKEF